MDAKYKLVITIAYFALIIIVLAVVGLIIAFRPDATATIIQFAGTTLTVASTAAVTFYMLGKIATQTNGANTALRERNEQLENQVKSLIAQAPSVKPAEDE